VFIFYAKVLIEVLDKNEERNMTPTKRKPGRPRGAVKSSAKAKRVKVTPSQNTSAEVVKAEAAVSKAQEALTKNKERLAVARKKATDSASKARKSRSVTAKNSA